MVPLEAELHGISWDLLNPPSLVQRRGSSHGWLERPSLQRPPGGVASARVRIARCFGHRRLRVPARSVEQFPACDPCQLIDWIHGATGSSMLRFARKGGGETGAADLIGSGGDPQADGEYTLMAPVRLRGLEPAESLSCSRRARSTEGPDSLAGSRLRARTTAGAATPGAPCRGRSSRRHPGARAP